MFKLASIFQLLSSTRFCSCPLLLLVYMNYLLETLVSVSKLLGDELSVFYTNNSSAALKKGTMKHCAFQWRTERHVLYYNNPPVESTSKNSF